MNGHRYSVHVALLASALAALAASGDPTLPTDPRLPALTAATLTAWRAHIGPSAEERAWEQIPWRPTFLDGLRAARAQHRPLLLWVMNGHPLGCT